MPGPLPKPDAQRRRRNKPGKVESFEIQPDKKTHGPALPPGDWPEPTRSWWHHLRTSDQASVIEPTGWDYLLDCLPLHRRIWEEGSVPAAAELRLRLAKFALTPEDAIRLRMTVVEPAPRQRRSPSRYAHLRPVVPPVG
jgi:hypothetical protein